MTAATDVLLDAIREAVRDEIRTVVAQPELRLLRTTEVAARLGVSDRFVENLTASGTLTSVKVGHSRRVRSDVLDAYIASLGGSS